MMMMSSLVGSLPPSGPGVDHNNMKLKMAKKLKMGFSICSQLCLRSRKTEEEETEETEDRAETGETVLHHVFVQQFFRRVDWLLGHLLGADWTFGFLRPSRVSDLQVRQTCGGPVSSDHSVCLQ